MALTVGHSTATWLTRVRFRPGSFAGPSPSLSPYSFPVSLSHCPVTNKGVKKAQKISKKKVFSSTSPKHGCLVSLSPGQKLSHVLLTHAPEHLELLQVAHVRLLVLAEGDALPASVELLPKVMLQTLML